MPDVRRGTGRAAGVGEGRPLAQKGGAPIDEWFNRPSKFHTEPRVTRWCGAPLHHSGLRGTGPRGVWRLPVRVFERIRPRS